MFGKPWFRIVIGTCVIGFLSDVFFWLRGAPRSFSDAFGQYWWAILFVVTYGGAVIARQVGRRGRQ